MGDTIVLKFGGAALESLEHFDRVVEIIIERKKYYKKLVVVVSAMAGVTDQLLKLAAKVHCNPPKREQDMLLSVGERVSMSLLAMILSQRGHQAISFTGSQTGIITSDEHLDAKILDVRPHRIVPYLEDGDIVIVAGFQGVSQSKEITTLGRGGTDTTAVALGVALNAEKVEFYKDVKGIFQSNPKEDPRAKHLPKLSYEMAYEIAQKGKRKILHPRAVVLAAKNHVPLVVRSFLKEEAGHSGSVVVVDDLKRVEKPIFEELEPQRA